MIPLSLAPKPEPVTVSGVPTAPLVLVGGIAIVAWIVKETDEVDAAVVIGPLAAMVWAPPAAAGMTMLADHCPLSLASIVEPMGLPSKVSVIPLSLAAKPEPVTVTAVMAVPVFLLIEIPAPMLKVMSVSEEVEDPRTLTAWVPPADAGTENVSVHAPVELAWVVEPTGVPSKVTLIPVSPEAKPEPLAVTDVPAAPLVLFIEKLGVTLKERAGTEAASVVDP
jgi:hypothetical protein